MRRLESISHFHLSQAQTDYSLAAPHQIGSLCISAYSGGQTFMVPCLFASSTCWPASDIDQCRFPSLFSSEGGRFLYPPFPLFLSFGFGFSLSDHGRLTPAIFEYNFEGTFLYILRHFYFCAFLPLYTAPKGSFRRFLCPQMFFAFLVVLLLSSALATLAPTMAPTMSPTLDPQPYLAYNLSDLESTVGTFFKASLDTKAFVNPSGLNMTYDLVAQGSAFRPDWLSWDALNLVMQGVPPAANETKLVAIATNEFALTVSAPFVLFSTDADGNGGDDCTCCTDCQIGVISGGAAVAFIGLAAFYVRSKGSMQGQWRKKEQREQEEEEDAEIEGPKPTASMNMYDDII